MNELAGRTALPTVGPGQRSGALQTAAKGVIVDGEWAAQ